jgi:hypothetical protein
MITGDGVLCQSAFSLATAMHFRAVEGSYFGAVLFPPHSRLGDDGLILLCTSAVAVDQS